MRVLLHGLKYFCNKLPGVFQSDGWDIRFHPADSAGSLFSLLRDLQRADLLFVWGARISMGRVLRAARVLNKKKVILFWCGSDVLRAQAERVEGILNPWIAKQIHWAGAPWLAHEIRALGVPCEYVPITWVPRVKSIPVLPAKFSVLVYMPRVRLGELYGLARILEVARSLPKVSFELVGLVEGHIPDPPPNLKIFGRIQDEDMKEFYRRATVYWRPVSHDGLSFMSLEALSYGRYVVWSYPFPHCAEAGDAAQDKAEIERLHAMHQANELPLNEPGLEMVCKDFSPERIREVYLGRWGKVIGSSDSMDCLRESKSRCD
jgi:glycosyltransferase involved in cell wall biosynthesis